ncbi:hypothetical protein B6N60_04074 [Richelia sinica FACHB-800]|uniref:Uncharacterized protein n=1 Tax=Richelia sinica FACHB-800 TaxID=1357546 RepID=A0A975TAX7_9NOST|nr:hypothetical protein B6N60_04074 [Richelia sinica FACHB-800]
MVVRSLPLLGDGDEHNQKQLRAVILRLILVQPLD